MPDRDASDCPPPGDGASIYTQRVPAILDRALANAGVTKTVRAKVQASLDELKYADGQVACAWTNKSERVLFVTGPRDGSIFAKFAFPPNASNLEAELLRAQDTGRIVSVVYTEDAAGNHMLEDVWIYAGVAAGSNPRY